MYKTRLGYAYTSILWNAISPFSKSNISILGEIEMTEAPCENLKENEDVACIDARFLHLCIDGDVEDLVCLLEDMARVGEVLTPEIINLTDSSGKVL